MKWLSEFKETKIEKKDGINEKEEFKEENKEITEHLSSKEKEKNNNELDKETDKHAEKLKEEKETENKNELDDLDRELGKRSEKLKNAEETENKFESDDLNKETDKYAEKLKEEKETENKNELDDLNKELDKRFEKLKDAEETENKLESDDLNKELDKRFEKLKDAEETENKLESDDLNKEIDEHIEKLKELEKAVDKLLNIKYKIPTETLNSLKESNEKPIEKQIEKIEHSKTHLDKLRENEDRTIKEIEISRDLLKLMKNYYRETGKWANRGLKITKTFENWIENNEKISNEKKIEHIKRCDRINENKEIEKTIVYRLKNFNDSQIRVKDDLQNMGFRVAEGVISKVARKYDLNIRDKWDKLTLETAVKDFKNRIIPDIRRKLKEKDLKKDGVPRKEEIKKYGYGKWMWALERKGINYNDVVKTAGYKPNYEFGKWENLTLKKAVNYFQKEVLPDIIEKLKENGINLGEYNVPKRNEIRKYGHCDWLSAIERNGIKYTDVVKTAGYKPNYEFGKWEDLTLNKATTYFQKEILPDVSGKLKNKGRILGKNDVPSMDEVRKNGYSDWLSAIKNKGIKYNDIIEKAGYKPNYERGKWEDLTLDKAVKYFKDEIFPNVSEILKEKGRILGIKEVPPKRVVKENGYSDWISAIERKNISYNKIIEKAGLKPNELDVKTEIGNNVHITLERIFLDHTKNLGCDSYREIYPTIRDNLNHSDNCVIRNELFEKSIESKSDLITIPRNIKIINFDYTMGFDNETIYGKCEKGYQGKEKMLIIIPLTTNENNIITPLHIQYRNHVKILNPYEFANFMGYEGKNLNDFMNTVRLAREAIYNPLANEELRRLAEINKKYIENNEYTSMQEKLKQKLKKMGRLDLLEKSPSDIKTLVDFILNEKK
ncbi:MAG: hypothetical protein HWN67_18290 [Candidatus Helarchaeota archaeon]|nr:hypothetical protein [Candidatus Helarchaeota archaeon]